MNEILTFQSVLDTKFCFLENENYEMQRQENFNEGNNNTWHRSTFLNKTLNKKIIFDYHPSSREIMPNIITVSLIGPDQTGFDLASYLAYRQKGTTISSEDTIPFRFHVHQDALVSSIDEQLDRALQILFTDLNSCTTSTDWFTFPIKDPRDDY